MQTVRFYYKNVNEGPKADFAYIGSVAIAADAMHTANLTAHADSIAGALYGPLLAMVEGEYKIRVLRH